MPSLAFQSRRSTHDFKRILAERPAGGHDDDYDDVGHMFCAKSYIGDGPLPGCAKIHDVMRDCSNPNPPPAITSQDS